MKVQALYRTGLAIEENVVETVKAGALDLFDFVVGSQELLFPSHEDILAVFDLRVIVVLLV